MTPPFKDCNQHPILVHGEAGNDHFYQLLRLRSMDDPLPKTAQDYYTYRINAASFLLEINMQIVYTPVYLHRNMIFTN